MPTEDKLKGLNAKQRKDAVQGALVGGATTFHSLDMKRKLDVMPKSGRILLFQHRSLLHSGDDVLKGVKYTLRTDLMYTLESSRSAEKARMPFMKGEVSGPQTWQDYL